MSDVDTTRKLEDKLLSDKSFQHILKFAPASQRELMTFELAKYFESVLDQLLDDLLEAMPEKRNGSVDAQTGAPVGMQGCVDHGFDLALADVTATIHQLKSSKKGADDDLS